MSLTSKDRPSTDVVFQQRMMMADQLSRRFSKSGTFWSQTRSLRKRILWATVIGFTHGIKRFFDIVASLFGLILLSPLFAVVAICIKLEDPKGPILFWQRRVGQYGQEFNFPKFRSMVYNAEELKAELMEKNQHGDESITFKMTDDPRITKVGRLIRRSSIDELPQLWCIFTGSMSLVGPRPAVPNEVAQYSYAQRRRLEVKPGLTCLWQVSGRSDIPFEGQVRLDEEYINSQSTKSDLIILLKTIPAVLTGRGAY
ncbi:MAG: sugar transferase [Planctomycetia bacterium]|jgi:lipopolysaccharide/colanic/teichoic acid biosynthesis glycosyltransferase